MEKRRDQQTRTESKTRLVGQINICLHSGDYSRALDLSPGTAAVRNDGELRAVVSRSILPPVPTLLPREPPQGSRARPRLKSSPVNPGVWICLSPRAVCRSGMTPAPGNMSEILSFAKGGTSCYTESFLPRAPLFFSAMPTKVHLLQWVLNYTDPKNYVLFQMDDNNFYRTVIRNGEKTDELKVPDKGDKKSFRTLQIRAGPTEFVHQIKHGDSWTVLDRWTQPGANVSLSKFGFYIPGNDQVALSSFAHYADLKIR